MRHLLLRLLDITGRTFDRLSRISLHVSGGLVRLADLKRGVVQTWNGFLLQDASIDRGLWDWEAGAADEVVRPGMRVLVVGCGSGRDLIALIGRGCAAVGIDPAPAAVAVARQSVAARGLTAEIHLGFFEDVPLPPGQFDVIWFSWFCYSYIPARERRIAVLRRAASLLPANGRMVLSVLVQPPPNRLWRVARTVGRLTGSDWIIEPGDVIERRADSHLLQFSHVFAPGEIEQECAAAGMQVERSMEDASVFVLRVPP